MDCSVDFSYVRYKMQTGYKMQTTVDTKCRLQSADYLPNAFWEKRLFSSCHFITYPLSRSHFSEVFVDKISPVSSYVFKLRVKVLLFKLIKGTQRPFSLECIKTLFQADWSTFKAKAGLGCSKDG